MLSMPPAKATSANPARITIELYPGTSLLEDAHHLIVGAGGESEKVTLLPCARLVGGGDSAVEGGTLSLLNPPSGMVSVPDEYSPKGGG